MDIRDLKFEDESFDVLIDKGRNTWLRLSLTALTLAF